MLNITTGSITDFEFKKIFGTEPNKDLLIDFLNQLLAEKEGKIVDLTSRPTRLKEKIFKKLFEVAEIAIEMINDEMHIKTNEGNIINGQREQVIIQATEPDDLELAIIPAHQFRDSTALL